MEKYNDIEVLDNSTPVITADDRNKLQIAEEFVRKKYLSRLEEMRIVPALRVLPLEDDIIDNIRLYKVSEMVYSKDEIVTDKFTTVFNTLSTYNASVFIMLDSDGEKTDFYIGVRNNETDERLKCSTVSLGETLKNTLVGHFPGTRISGVDRRKIAELSERISSRDNVASVSVVGSPKSEKGQNNQEFVQGIEKLALSMEGRRYIGIIIAENQASENIQELRNFYQQMYTNWSPFQKVQFSYNESRSTSKNKSFFEMSGKQKASMIGGLVASVGGMISGGLVGNAAKSVGIATGTLAGGQIGGQISQFITSLAPSEQKTESKSTTTSTTTENKAVTDVLHVLDEMIQKTREYDSYGMWNVAGYFASDDMTSAEMAASNYRALMNGDKSGREVSAVNSWRKNSPDIIGKYEDLTSSLSRFIHPLFCYGENYDNQVLLDATTSISGKDLGLHLGLPRVTVSGLPVIEHAEFGKEVTVYHTVFSDESQGPENRMTLGKVFDLGRTTNKPVELKNNSLNMHTFITGSTGSGKSNTVYQMLCELHQDRIPFLVIEPAKGEYKDVFGNWKDVNVFSTNPNVAELINLNPFRFPDSIHVLEHVDGLVEIFSACWPMYDAMPSFFKDAMLKSYETVGWDLGSSTFDGDEIEYPDFEVLAEQLDELIENSDYASDIKSNYRGALITRVKSLTVGLNKFIFTSEQTPYSRIFDQNCILDISRVKSIETKALIMGMMVYILNEYRADQKETNNNGLKHVTVLEEAHNLLKNTDKTESDLVGKSVEMLTQTIAEIRTYGEGFIIVDQSPSSVDISAIKNTNTKIVLRTPEAGDREAVGRSMGLTANQVNEIAKLPSGVAVVYQNDWVTPVLTRVAKAPVEEERYVNDKVERIVPVKVARNQVIKAIMEPWFPGEKLQFVDLVAALDCLNVSREHRKYLSTMIYTYEKHNGHMVWDENSLGLLKKLLMDIMDITDSILMDIIGKNNPDNLRKLVKSKIKNFSQGDIEEICYILTKEE
ncbi:ATP-binding protein [Eubacterium xylanophilum]|uniref:ATP-binding protein n=1 Tax=Eubacterium xylanophilum TaxID=39497 RepID=UPI0004B0E58A|nr:ATP-binding protein [Eubacterium xylanophilum]